MNNEINVADVVALTNDILDKGLLRGQVGPVVEVLAPGVYEVEFSDDTGKTYAMVTLRHEQLMLLHLRPAKVA